jgi:hypothetical protein
LRNALPPVPGISANIPAVTVVDDRLKSPIVHSVFLGLQRRLSDRLTIEINAVGTWGRELITTDLINREWTYPLIPIMPGNGRYRVNPRFPDLDYRANQGHSAFRSFSATARWRTDRSSLYATYTVSRSTDVQSDPLGSNFFNLDPNVLQTQGIARFPIQFEPESNAGFSDYDQRHNVVLYGYTELPAAFQQSRWFGPLLRDWRVAQLAAFRSGFPFSVKVQDQRGPNIRPVVDARANRREGVDVYTNQPAAGGRLLLDRSAFQPPSPGQLGTTLRNEFRGPGFFNFDVSVSRSLPVSWPTEAAAFTIRADAFNVLNHANLNSPYSFIGASATDAFGLARYGRRGVQSGFPALLPFTETGRQIQLMLKFEF